jgi:hypothetical protein
MAKVSTPYIFNKSNNNLSYCYYNGGWSSWNNSKLNGGYAGDGSSFKYCVALKFTTPAFDGVSENFKITIPYCRSINTKQAASGILKLKLTTSNPRDSNLSDALANCDVTANWSAKNSSGYADRAIHTLEVTFTDKLLQNTTYYIVIGVKDGSGSGGSSANQDWIEIGEYTKQDVLWKATLNTYYTEGEAPTINIKNNGNNTFTISGTLGKVESPNSMTAASLYYTTNGLEPAGGSSYTTKIELKPGSGLSYSCSDDIPPTCTTVWAVTYNSFAYGPSKNTGHKRASMTYYAAPSWPTDAKVELHESSFKNKRLVTKQDWGWDWTLADQANNSSPVKCYRIRCFIKRKGTNSFVNTPIINYWDKATRISTELSAGDWVYDRDASYDLPMPMAAGDFEEDLKPGDKIKLSVQAYSVNDLGEALLSSEIASKEYTIENAGVVNIKVNTGTATKPVYEWVEGQVWIKSIDKWEEAETVSIKTADGWIESQ